MVFIEEFEDLADRIFKCSHEGCEYWKDWKRFEKIHYGEHRLPSQWLFWYKNKFPCKREMYHTLYLYNPKLFNDERSSLVFIALRPSTEWISHTDILFADALVKLRLLKERYEFVNNIFILYEGVLVTDLIKCRGLAKRRLQSVPVNCINFLKEELELVERLSKQKPRVVAVGSKTRDLLWKYRRDLGLKWSRKEDVPKILHYTQRREVWLKEYKEETEKTLRRYYPEVLRI